MDKISKFLVSFLVVLFLAARACFAYPIFENEDFIFSIDNYLRLDSVTLKNVVDLDNASKDSSVTYLGLDYSAGLKYESKNDFPSFFLKLERNGPFDYDAPVFIHKRLKTSDGFIGEYRKEELLPQVEEFWFDAGLWNKFRIKPGLYAYSVGNGFSLNGGYENFGCTLYRQWSNALWRFYYCRPDLVYREHLGPHIHQEQEQGISYEHNAANFFATDVKLDTQNGWVNPYIGVLSDYTSSGKRDNLFSSPVNKDILGTFGLAWDAKKGNFSWQLEMAQNFGKAESSDDNFKDIYHTGYLFFADLGYSFGRLIPAVQFLLCSGNKVSLEAVQNQEEALTSGKNRAFSYASPLNLNLADSISSVYAEKRPIVAMGSGYGLNYGIPRPKTFFASDFDNLIAPSFSLDFKATQKLSLTAQFYYLMSFERGAGILNGEARFLSRQLGKELDLSIDYAVNKNILVNLLTGVFFPGRFYREKREDASGSLLTPFVRGDGEADAAYQIELVLEFTY